MTSYFPYVVLDNKKILPLSESSLIRVQILIVIDYDSLFALCVYAGYSYFYIYITLYLRLFMYSFF